MEIIHWIIGALLIIIAVWILMLNWISIILSIATRRFHSQVPFVGSLLAILGELIIPIEMPHKILYFLPVLLDSGTIIYVLSLMCILYKMIKSQICRA